MLPMFDVVSMIIKIASSMPMEEAEKRITLLACIAGKAVAWYESGGLSLN